MSTTPPDDDRTQVVPPPAFGGGGAPKPPDAAGPNAAAAAPVPLTEVDFEPTMMAPPAAAPAAAAPVPKTNPPTPPSPSPSHSASSAGDSGNALPVGTYLSEFELTGVIGEGGFGIVYHAWDHSLQRKVALKEYMPASLASREKSAVQVRSQRHKETFDAGLKSFINEARLLAQFDHPSLVKVYRFWEANGTAYMVMPLYEGTTLKDKLRQMAGKPDEGWLMALLAPLTEALAVIHKENCFHRDIAPDNVILLAGSERPLLLDFGAARRVIGDMTQALTVILKPGYAPVEQYAESPDMKQGSWTDVYALAATVHWAIMGKTPPPSVSRLMNDSFIAVSKSAAGRYSERFLAAIDHALQVRPENRTHSIAAFRADIGLDGSYIPMGAPTPTQFPGQVPGGVLPTAMPNNPPPTAYAPTQMAGYNPSSMATVVMPQGPRTGMAPPTQMQPTGWQGVAPQRADEVTMMAPRGAAAQQALAEATFPGTTITAPARTPAPPPGGAAPAPQNKSMVWIGIAAALLVVGAVGGYMALGGKAPTPAPVATAPAPVPAAPVAAAPAPAPVASPPAAFNLREQFERVIAGQSQDFILNAFSAQTQFSIKKREKIFFELTSTRDGYVTLLNRDGAGGLFLMLPNKETKEVRIKAGQRLRLPDKNGLEAFEPPGTDQFLVIVSDKPRDYSELSPSADPGGVIATLPTGDAAAKLAAGWKRSTPLLVGAPQAGCQGPSCDAYGAVLFTVQVIP